MLSGGGQAQAAIYKLVKINLAQVPTVKTFGKYMGSLLKSGFMG